MSSYTENISIPNEHIQNIFGQFDRNIKNLEKAYHVTVVLRGDELKIAGEEDNVKMAISVIEQMISLSKNGNFRPKY